MMGNDVSECTGTDRRCAWGTVDAGTGFLLRTGCRTRGCMVLFHALGIQQTFFEHLLCGWCRFNLASVWYVSTISVTVPFGSTLRSIDLSYRKTTEGKSFMEKARLPVP